jgi:hypothetical protein
VADKFREPDIDNLPEKIHEGITLGPEAKEEADEKFPPLAGAPDLSYLGQERRDGIAFRAVEQGVGDSLLLRFPDGRLFRDVDVAFSADDRKRVELGYVCIRCLEPQSQANADEHLDGCIGVSQYGERYMRDGYHLIDVAAEFDEREVHVGPSRPLRAYLDRMDERRN